MAHILGMLKDKVEHSGTDGKPIRVSFGGRYRPADGAASHRRASDIGERELVLRWAPIPGTAQEAFSTTTSPTAATALPRRLGIRQDADADGEDAEAVGDQLPAARHLDRPRLRPHRRHDPRDAEDRRPGDRRAVAPRDAASSTTTTSDEAPADVGRRRPDPVHVRREPDSIAGPNVAFAGMDEPGSSPVQGVEEHQRARPASRARSCGRRSLAGTSEGLNHIADLFGPDRDQGYYKYVMTTLQNPSCSNITRSISSRCRRWRPRRSCKGLSRRQDRQHGRRPGVYPMFDAERAVSRRSTKTPACRCASRSTSTSIRCRGDRPAVARARRHRIRRARGARAAGVDGRPDVRRDHQALSVARRRRRDLRRRDRQGAQPSRACARTTTSSSDRLRVIGPLVDKVPMANPPVTRRLNSVNRLCRDGRGV
jgi:hypothetical protein